MEATHLRVAFLLYQEKVYWIRKTYWYECKQKSVSFMTYC